MSLSKDQITTLLSLVTSADSDKLDCDGCFEHLAEFAELNLADKEIPEAMAAVVRHLEQCVCCQDEYNGLLVALKELEENQ